MKAAAGSIVWRRKKMKIEALIQDFNIEPDFFESFSGRGRKAPILIPRMGIH